MKLVSLKLDPKDAAEEVSCDPKPSDAPMYPYGTCLYLDEDEQKKLGIKDMPDVGTEFPIEAVVVVVGTSERQTQGGTRKTLDLQIVKLGIGIEEEPQTMEDKAAAQLYGNKAKAKA